MALSCRLSWRSVVTVSSVSAWQTRQRPGEGSAGEAGSAAGGADGEFDQPGDVTLEKGGGRRSAPVSDPACRRGVPAGPGDFEKAVEGQTSRPGLGQAGHGAAG